MNTEKTIKIVLVDDHHVVRKGVKLLFSSEDNFKVIGDFSNATEAIEFISKNEVDILLTDITMPDFGGIALAKKVKHDFPHTKIIMLTMHLDTCYVVEAMENGVDGYLLKDANEQEIIDGVNAVSEGQLYMVKAVSDVLSKALLAKGKLSKESSENTLTIREKEILKCIVGGLSNKMISAELSISERTVNAHRYNIMKKLKAKNSANLVRISIEQNLC